MSSVCQFSLIPSHFLFRVDNTFSLTSPFLPTVDDEFPFSPTINNEFPLSSTVNDEFSFTLTVDDVSPFSPTIVEVECPFSPTILLEVMQGRKATSRQSFMSCRLFFNTSTIDANQAPYLSIVCSSCSCRKAFMINRAMSFFFVLVGYKV